MPNTVGNDVPCVLGGIENPGTAEYESLRAAFIGGFDGEKINPIIVNADGSFVAAYAVTAPQYHYSFSQNVPAGGTVTLTTGGGRSSEFRLTNLVETTSGGADFNLVGRNAAGNIVTIAVFPDNGAIVLTEAVLDNFAPGTSPSLVVSGLVSNSQFSVSQTVDAAAFFDAAAPTVTVQAFSSAPTVPAGGVVTLFAASGLIEAFTLENSAAWTTGATQFRLVLNTHEPIDLTGFSGPILQANVIAGAQYRTTITVSAVDGVVAVPPTILQQLQSHPAGVVLQVVGAVVNAIPQAQATVELPVTTINEGLFVQHFGADGLPTGDAIRVDEAANARLSDEDARNYTMSRAPDGSLMISWLGNADTNDTADAVYIRKLDDAGNPLGGTVALSGLSPDGVSAIVDQEFSVALTELTGGGFAAAYIVNVETSETYISANTPSLPIGISLANLTGQLERVDLTEFSAAGALSGMLRGETVNGTAVVVNVTFTGGSFEMTDALRAQFAPASHLSLTVTGLTPSTHYEAIVVSRDIFEFNDTSTLTTINRTVTAGNQSLNLADATFGTGLGQPISFAINSVTLAAGQANVHILQLTTAHPLDFTGLTIYAPAGNSGVQNAFINGTFVTSIVVNPVNGVVTVPPAILAQIDGDELRVILGISGLQAGTTANVDITLRSPSHISVPGVYVQQFAASGAAEGPAVRIDLADAALPSAAMPGEDDAALAISADSDGGFRVTWIANSNDDSGDDRIVSREFDADGNASGTTIDISKNDIPGLVAADAAGGETAVPDQMQLVELGGGTFAALVQVDASEVLASISTLALAQGSASGSVTFAALRGQLDSVRIDTSDPVGAALAAEPRAGYVAGKGLDGNALQVPVIIINGRFEMSEAIRAQFLPNEELSLTVTGVTNPASPNSVSFVFVPAYIGSRDIFSFDEDSATLSINRIANALNNTGASAGNSDVTFSSSIGQTVAFQVNNLTAGAGETPEFVIITYSDEPIDPTGLLIYAGPATPPFYTSIPNTTVYPLGQFSTTIAVTPVAGRIDVPQALLDQFPHGGLNISLGIRGLQGGTPVNVDIIVQQPSHVLNTGLFVQLFDNAGVATGELIRIDDPATSVAVVDEDYSQSSIQSDGAGGFRVVWKSDVDGDGDADGINIRHFNSSGVQIGDTTSIGSIPDRIYDEREAVTLYTSGLFADPDPGDVLTFSAVGLPDGLHINSATGVITGAATDLGLFAITVRATDSGGLFASTDFDILILNDVTEPSVRFADPGAILVSNFAVGAGGWSSQDLYPRHIADVNGDGRSDIVGFGQAGVLVSFGAANGTFSNAGLVVSNFGQASGWSSDNSFHRELADVNGDGRADIVGFGIAGTLVSLAKADGTFSNPGTGVANFGANQGWSTQNAFARTVGDVNGDGKADLIGFGYAGTLVSLGNGDGTFKPASVAVANFGVDQGWTSDNLFHRTVADVNGDGADDIVGFGYDGTLVALSNGDGTFGGAKLVLNNFGKNQGWASQDAFTRDVADVNNDGRADIVGFGTAGTYVAYGRLDGTFSPASRDVDNFGTDQGWISDATYHREIADINNDGLNDIVGFGYAGVFASLNQGDELLI